MHVRSCLTPLKCHEAILAAVPPSIQTLDLDPNPQQNKKMTRHRFLLFAAIFCFLGLYSLEAAHHHVKDADEMACAICHVAAHSAADTPAPIAAPAFSLVLLFLISFAEVSFRLCSTAVKPRSRSPPAFS